MPQNRDSRSMGTVNPWVTYLLGALLTLLSGVAAYQNHRLSELESFASKGARWTRADALDQRLSIIAEIKREYPPPWLRRRVDKLEDRLDRLENKERGSTTLPGEGVGG